MKNEIKVVPIGMGCVEIAADGKCAPVVWFGSYPADKTFIYGEATVLALQTRIEELEQLTK